MLGGFVGSESKALDFPGEKLHREGAFSAPRFEGKNGFVNLYYLKILETRKIMLASCVRVC